MDTTRTSAICAYSRSPPGLSVEPGPQPASSAAPVNTQSDGMGSWPRETALEDQLGQASEKGRPEQNDPRGSRRQCRCHLSGIKFGFNQAGWGEESERHQKRHWHLQGAAGGCGDPVWPSQMEGSKSHLCVFSFSRRAARPGQRAAPTGKTEPQTPGRAGYGLSSPGLKKEKNLSIYKLGFYTTVLIPDLS